MKRIVSIGVKEEVEEEGEGEGEGLVLTGLKYMVGLGWVLEV